MSTAVQNNAAAAFPGTGTEAVKSNGEKVSDLFLTLLVAQIRNQDPLAPMESKDFVNQFASMSQVEMMENLASLTSASAALQESMLVVSLGSQVGSEVMVATDSVALGGDAVRGGFVLESAVADATVVLKGSDGVEHRIALGAQDAGTVDFRIDPQALGLKAGRYSLRVDTGTDQAPRTEIQGQLQSVRLDASGAVVLAVSGVGNVGTGEISRFLGRSGGVPTFSSNGV